MTDSQTTMDVAAAPANTSGYLTIRLGYSDEEDVKYTGLTGLQLTGLLRGLSKTALTDTEVAGLKKAHDLNTPSSLNIVDMTTIHYIINNKTDKDDAETISGDWTFTLGLKTATARYRPTTITDGSDNELIEFDFVGSAVNHWKFSNAATGNAIQARPAGDDADINMDLDGKGTGVVILGDASKMASNAAPTADEQIANKKYVDDQITASALGDASYTAKGVSERATSSEIFNGTATGGTSAPLFVNPSDLQNSSVSKDSSSGSADAGKFIKSNTNGLLDDTFLGGAIYALNETVIVGEALCLLPYEIRYYTGQTEGNLNLGDANAKRKRAVKLVAPASVSGITTMYFRGQEVGLSTMTLTVTIETDSSGEPSGTPITNGTANTIDTSTWGTSYAERTITWSTGFDLTAGTTYWLVFSVDKTDAANYIQLSMANSYINNYPDFIALIYDLDTTTWGSSSTTNIPFFYLDNAGDLGATLQKTNANYPARTFKFVGFAREAGNQGNSIIVDREKVSSGISTQPNIPYYLSDTAGDISDSPGTYQYRVGYGGLDDTLNIKTGPKVVTGSASNTSSGANNTDYDFIELGFKIDKLTCLIGYGSGSGAYAHNSEFGTNFGDGINSNGANLSIWENGNYYGFSLQESTDQIIDYSPALARYLDSFNDTCIVDIENITDYSFRFSYEDTDGCVATQVTINWVAEGS
jgi:hypothetical protein